MKKIIHVYCKSLVYRGILCCFFLINSKALLVGHGQKPDSIVWRLPTMYVLCKNQTNVTIFIYNMYFYSRIIIVYCRV